LVVPVIAGLWIIWPSELVSSAGETARQAALPAASFASYTETISGTSVTFDMVAVPGGTFQMGSPAGEQGRDSDEGPVHAVTVRPFWIGRFEVTWDEYDRYAFSTEAVTAPPGAGSAPPSADAVTRPTPPYGDESFGFGKERQPAINMTHHGAMEYTHWLSRVTGKAYRLPTEAEWELAARAGSTDAYSFGRDARALGEYAWYEANAEDRPHLVGQKKPNALGIHDMHGNVAEWCLDQYADDFYRRVAKEGKAAGALVALLPGPGRFPHVVRGGSWADDAKELRSAARRGSTERWSRRDPQNPRSIWWHTDGTIVGFRVARAVDEYPELRGFRSKMTPNSRDR
jgi:formylglycine-generating enzyme required for sulfatase activity